MTLRAIASFVAGLLVAAVALFAGAWFALWTTSPDGCVWIMGVGGCL